MKYVYLASMEIRPAEGLAEMIRESERRRSTNNTKVPVLNTLARSS